MYLNYSSDYARILVLFVDDFCIAEAVRKTGIFSSATDKQTEDPAKDWIRFAGDRSGRRRFKWESKKSEAVNKSVTDSISELDED